MQPASETFRTNIRCKRRNRMMSLSDSANEDSKFSNELIIEKEFSGDKRKFLECGRVRLLTAMMFATNRDSWTSSEHSHTESQAPNNTSTHPNKTSRIQNPTIRLRIQRNPEVLQYFVAPLKIPTEILNLDNALRIYPSPGPSTRDTTDITETLPQMTALIPNLSPLD